MIPITQKCRNSCDLEFDDFGTPNTPNFNLLKKKDWIRDKTGIMSFNKPDNTIFPIPQTSEQKFQNDFNRQQMSALFKYLNIGNRNFPTERNEFELRYSITDEKWKEEPELSNIRNYFFQISENCKEFNRQEIFKKSIRLFQDIIKLCKEFNEDDVNGGDGSDYDRVVKIINNWEEDYKQNINDVINKNENLIIQKRKKEFEDWCNKTGDSIKNFEKEVNDINQKVSDFKNRTNEDWQIRLKTSIHRLDEKFAESKKKRIILF